MGKGENAGYEQFILFPQCFPMIYTAERIKNQGLFGKGISKSELNSLVLSHCVIFFPKTKHNVMANIQEQNITEHDHVRQIRVEWHE